LAASFLCIETKKAVPCLEEYGTQFASEELPGWEYVLMQTWQMVALGAIAQFRGTADFFAVPGAGA
jgi:hypothetical protein